MIEYASPKKVEMPKVLILKTGYTETLCAEPFKEGKVSLGDVLRTTAILHLYKDCHVTWITDEKAVPLLEGNPLIHRILEFNHTTILQVSRETYDVMINLEKNPGMCALADQVHAWQKYGFRFNRESGESDAYNNALDALYVARNENIKAGNTKHWLAHLYAILGHSWAGEGYVVRTIEPVFEQPHYMVGLNWHVGGKFEGKRWPGENWDKLALNLRGQHITYTRQQEPNVLMPNPLEYYMRWISQHSLIVSCDSLGLHLAIAMGKRVVGLFGPTPAKEIQPYKNGIMIQKARMEDITTDEVQEAVKELFNWGGA